MKLKKAIGNRICGQWMYYTLAFAIFLCTVYEISWRERYGLGKHFLFKKNFDKKSGKLRKMAVKFTS